MQYWRYDVPEGKVGRCFVWELSTNVQGVRAMRWNAKRLIIIQRVILQHTRHMSGAQAIQRRIGKHLDVWEVGQHQILVEETDHRFEQYLSASTTSRRSTSCGIPQPDAQREASEFCVLDPRA